jgi:hypothetical protein
MIKQIKKPPITFKIAFIFLLLLILGTFNKYIFSGCYDYFPAATGVIEHIINVSSGPCRLLNVKPIHGNGILVLGSFDVYGKEGVRKANHIRAYKNNEMIDYACPGDVCNPAKIHAFVYIEDYKITVVKTFEGPSFPREEYERAIKYLSTALIVDKTLNMFSNS